MSIIDIDVARAHLRLEPDYPAQQVQPYLDAAEDAARQFLNRRIFADQAAKDAPVIQAINGMLLDVLAAVARKTSLGVIEVPGWERRGRGDATSAAGMSMRVDIRRSPFLGSGRCSA